MIHARNDTHETLKFIVGFLATTIAVVAIVTGIYSSYTLYSTKYYEGLRAVQSACIAAGGSWIMPRWGNEGACVAVQALPRKE